MSTGTYQVIEKKQSRKVTSSAFVASEGPYRRYPVYMYPARNPVYRHFVETWPAKGNASVLRKLTFEGWQTARGEMDAWIKRLRAVENEEDAPPPIPDMVITTTRETRRYNVYLRERDPSHLPIIQYSDSLEIVGEELRQKFSGKWSGKLRQRFFTLLLVRGSQVSDIIEKISGV